MCSTSKRKPCGSVKLFKQSEIRDYLLIPFLFSFNSNTDYLFPYTYLCQERILTLEKNTKHGLILVVHLYLLRPTGKHPKIDCNQDWLVRLKRKPGARCTTFLFWIEEITASLSLCYRSTYASWTMRCRIQTNAKGTLWLCMTAAAPWGIWRPSSAAPWPMTSCSARVLASSACGPMRAVGTADFRCSSHPSKNVRTPALGCLSFRRSRAAGPARGSRCFFLQCEHTRLRLTRFPFRHLGPETGESYRSLFGDLFLHRHRSLA